MRWEKNPLLRHPLNSLAQSFKMAHFDSRRTYVALGGELRTPQRRAGPSLGGADQVRRGLDRRRATSSATSWSSARAPAAPSSAASSPIGAWRWCSSRRASGSSARTFDGQLHPRPRPLLPQRPDARHARPCLVLHGQARRGLHAVNGGDVHAAAALRPSRVVRGSSAPTSSRPSACVPTSSASRQRARVSSRSGATSAPSPTSSIAARDALGWRVGPVPAQRRRLRGRGLLRLRLRQRRAAGRGHRLPPGGRWSAGALVVSGLRADRVIVEHGKAVGIEARRRRSPGASACAARAVVLAGGAVPTPLLLLRQGLANASGQVGKNLSVHPSVGAAAQFDELIEPQRHIPQGYMLTEFLRDGICVLAAQADVNVAHMLLPFTGDRLMHAVDYLAAPRAVRPPRSATRPAGRVWCEVGGHPAVDLQHRPRGRRPACSAALVHTARDVLRGRARGASTPASSASSRSRAAPTSIASSGRAIDAGGARARQLPPARHLPHGAGPAHQRRRSRPPVPRRARPLRGRRQHGPRAARRESAAHDHGDGHAGGRAHRSQAVKLHLRTVARAPALLLRREYPHEVRARCPGASGGRGDAGPDAEHAPGGDGARAGQGAHRRGRLDPGPVPRPVEGRAPPGLGSGRARLRGLLPVALGIYFAGLRSARFAQGAGTAVAFVDAPVIWVLQSIAMPLASSPGGTAGFSLGIFVLPRPARGALAQHDAGGARRRALDGVEESRSSTRRASRPGPGSPRQSCSASPRWPPRRSSGGCAGSSRA